jgi:hypothetical protein
VNVLVPSHPFVSPPKRTAPFNEEPGFYEPAGLWLYGNTRLLQSSLISISDARGVPFHSEQTLNSIEREAESHVLGGKTLVTGIHSPAHQRAAVVPLRWGAPRIVVFSGGFFHHLGRELQTEPFRIARLWRYEWDPNTDLAVSLRAPDRLPTFAKHNPTVDRLVDRICGKKFSGVLFSL